MTRTRFDQFGKQMVRDALESHGAVETDAEVPADTRRIDLWFNPDLGHKRGKEHLGLLGRMTSVASTLLGAGAVLKQAIAELRALPAEAQERTLALPVLLRLRLAVPIDPAKQTNDDQEFLMNTQDVVETWRREAIQEGITQGLEQGVQQGLAQGVKQGERKLLLRLLRRRFGNQVDRETEQRIVAASAEQIEVWAERVLSASTLVELLAD